ncbi:MAG: hypothetical protein WCY49_00355 [Anaerovoracaceae bacterium]
MGQDEFRFEDHILKGEDNKVSDSSREDFYEVCKIVKESFSKGWEDSGEYLEELIDIQKKAIMGYKEEAEFFKEKIKSILMEKGIEHSQFPPWYENLTEGVYHESFGMGPLAEWFKDEYKESSSLKVIGDRIYFLEKGTMVLKEQRISKERRDQLIRALLLLKPKERISLSFHELYLLDGTRVTVFKGDMVKENQEAIIFRRYIIPEYTFKEQAERGTIPYCAIDLFEMMVTLGFNVAFLGAVRTSKTTFLSTWQSMEDPSLEGVMVETDPEIPLEKLIPKAPLIQLLADKERMQDITKHLMRSDGDYIIMGEARDALSLDALIKITKKGTRRVKLTYHCQDPKSFPYDAAYEIARDLGGDLNFLVKRVAESFDFLFHFIQLKDKSQKRLNSIYQMNYDQIRQRVVYNRILKYLPGKDSWTFSPLLENQGTELAALEDLKVYREFKGKLKELSDNEEVK